MLLGPSGCGKSTLLNCIAGLLDVTDGQIWINGQERHLGGAEGPRHRHGVPVLRALPADDGARGTCPSACKIAGLPKDEIEKRIARAAEILQIEPLLDRKPAQLSGGQRQRVAIGRALVRDVDVFLFDEPLSNLDAKLRTELRVEIKRLHQQLENTMIYVTHDQIEALTLADRIAVMHGGVIQQLADPQTIYNRPANLFVAGFIGSPAMNFISGRDRRRRAAAGIRHRRPMRSRSTGYEFGGDAAAGAGAGDPRHPARAGQHRRASRDTSRSGPRPRSRSTSRWAPDSQVWLQARRQRIPFRTEGLSTMAKRLEDRRRLRSGARPRSSTRRPNSGSDRAMLASSGEIELSGTWRLALVGGDMSAPMAVPGDAHQRAACGRPDPRSLFRPQRIRPALDRRPRLDADARRSTLPDGAPSRDWLLEIDGLDTVATVTAQRQQWF